VYADVQLVDVPPALARDVGGYRRRLEEEPPERLRRRPAPDVWSPLEYSCHVRDVLEVQRARIAQTLTESVPVYEPMGRDERVVRDRYNDQDPAVVASELEQAASAFASAVTGLSIEEAARTGIYNHPAPAERDLGWLAAHTVHEVRHHLADVDRGL
jgi:S-DNA-T family DNA segregation ATPase FtsK/SpoIIIE